MRDLNKKNGDVCKKVRMLKLELDRVHEALSRDPSCIHLREEELVYSEGRVVKSRIESVYDEDGNMFQNDEMAVMFVEHFKSFFSKCDVIYPIEDHVNLFTKKLDPVTVVELISAVFDEEIVGNKMHKAFPLPGKSSHWQYKFPLPVN
nr:hypothetical protein [Tanacetum cinerariifolium]